MKNSTVSSITIHAAAIAALFIVHTQVRATTHLMPSLTTLQLTTPQQSKAAQKRSAKFTKMVKRDLSPTTYCHADCVAPTQHTETLVIDGTQVSITLPAGVTINTVNPLVVRAGSNCKPGVYIVRITSSYIPASYEVDTDPTAHFTYIVITGPGLFPVLSK